MRRTVFIIGFSLYSLFLPAQEARVLRFPHSVGDKVVFSYGGDIYTVAVSGGVARKLTSHVGYEMFPRFSPDGRHIAFTGQLDGNTEVYIIPSDGGEPRRLTYTATLNRDDPGDRMGPNNIVIGWTPDSKHVLFRSRCYSFNDFTGQLFTVPVEGGLPTEMPLKNGGFASFSPDGKKLAYNYIFREFRTWKRYAGGMTDDVRVVDLTTGVSEKITGGTSQEIIPMWAPAGGEIYFLSDADDVMNLYVYNLADKQTRRISHHRDYDIKFPAIGERRIVYEQGGDLYQYDLVKKQIDKIPVMIANDHPHARPGWRDVREEMTESVASPDGKRVLVAARGDIFSLPAQEGITYNLTNSSGANDRSPAWSPDGKYISYISDKEGEFTIYLRETSSGKERKLIEGFEGYIFTYKWSPDSRKIAWSEKRNTLNIIDLASGKNEVIEQSGVAPINAFNWSPDSRWITYVRPEKTMNNIVVHDVELKKGHVVTDGWYDAASPNFSDDGRFLLFSSARSFTPVYSRTEWNHVYTRMNKVYLLPLARDAAVPFAPRNDAPTGEASKEKKEKSKEVVLDFANLPRRVIEVPVIAADSYSNLHLLGQKLFYDRAGSTLVYDLETKQESETRGRLLFSNGYARGLALSGKALQVVEMPVTSVNITKGVPLDGLRRWVDYPEEWLQIYDESWRQMRDFFYARNMHGVEWKAIYEKYRGLVPHVKHRVDLTYLIGEMIGELNVGHAYSQNGNYPRPPREYTGLLGAKFEKDPSGYFRVKEVIEGANWSAATRSPLTMPGVEVKEGEYIIAIDGRSLVEVDNLFSELVGKANRTVELQVNAIPSVANARKVLVTPLADESLLYYYRWVHDNIKRVNEATQGAVGYIHIPDMGINGLNEFVKYYYPQLTKSALIIDDRGNGGGNVSPMIAERLARTPDFYTMHTNQAEGSVSPVGTFVGPKVLLVNEYSASDGDLFPYRFRHNNLGTIIGRRTWGGVVGYSGSIRVVDGGSIVTPSYAPFAADGSGFIIEGYGVEPDMDIANDPYREYHGEDAQLEKAIEVILEKIKGERLPPPPIPPFPDKARGHNHRE
ncbi:MAG: PDZ domain-containing protein [Odoribacteraceae bacterium]|jgi:tricorn protease|nr:PDZ domain-containing protein [Odoribacteraceae bacterium]